MFYNYSNMPALSADMTRETYRLLTNFSGLHLHSGYDENSDAVMIGIIKSPEKISETLRPADLRVAQSRAEKSVGGTRGKFYIPGGTTVSLYLQLIVIKKPTEEELTLLKSGIGDQVQKTSRIIFNEFIPLSAKYTREILDTEGTQVNATQNAGIQRRTTKDMASQAAINIRDMILYAF